MLGTFGEAGDRFSMTMTIISGAVAFLLVIVIGVSMLIQAGRVEEKFYRIVNKNGIIVDEKKILTVHIMTSILVSNNSKG